MFENTLNGRGRVVVAVVSLLGAMLLVTAVNADAARIKPKDGAFIQYATKSKKQFGYISTAKGKVVSAGGNLRFRDNKGKGCVPEGLYATEGLISFSFEAKRKVRPNSRNHFTIKVKHSSYYPKLKGSVSGKFKSRSRATISFKLASGNCKAKGTFRKALYTAGG